MQRMRVERIHIMPSQAVYLENMILQNWFFRTATPYVDSNSVKDSYFSITRTGAADLSSKTGTNGVDQTIAIDDSLQGKAYPYPIWTIYEPTAWQTGTRLYVGDWD